MTILALDTSTEILSLCCRRDNQFFEVTRNINLRHGEEIIPLTNLLLEQLGLSPRELDLVVSACGPGSFTGLRIGFATAQGLAEGAGCPLVSVPTLDIYGQFPSRQTLAVPLIDAKKKRFYAALYRNGERLSDYMDAAPEDIAAAARRYENVILTGPHAKKFWEVLGESEKAASAGKTFSLDPDAGTGKASVLLRLGYESFRSGKTGAAGLLYIREPEI
jgi:tRNA threonylcarbamoyladenosine biosynthesis protein TsaB